MSSKRTQQRRLAKKASQEADKRHSKRRREIDKSMAIREVTKAIRDSGVAASEVPSSVKTLDDFRKWQEQVNAEAAKKAIII